MITIYHLDNSRSERIVWLAEELGLGYEQRTTMRTANGLAPQEFRDIHPLGRAPVIRDGDITLIESGAIVDYLIERHGNGRLRPAVASPEYPRYLQWLHFAEGSAMSGLLMEYVAGMLQTDPAAPSPIMGMIGARNDEMLRFIDTELGRSAYFAGTEFSAADIMMEFVFAFLERAKGEKFATLPTIATWLKRVRARPAYAKAMTAAGPKTNGLQR